MLDTSRHLISERISPKPPTVKEFAEKPRCSNHARDSDNGPEPRAGIIGSVEHGVESSGGIEPQVCPQIPNVGGSEIYLRD